MSLSEAYDDDEAGRASGHSLRATRRGEVLGGTYRLLELVGAGGMAEVYSAEHLRLGRKFAVKVLRVGPSRQSLLRFRREASAIARIDNEFVVGVIDCGEAGDGTPYLVMELLRGEDLRSLLDREGALSIPRAVTFVWEACQGIAAVHALNLIHRDLKPENLYVSKRATGQDWCRVLDFGIAKADVSNSTAEGAVVGTVRYMAPEQLQDAASAGPRVDVYALGAVLYECLSGESPHSAGTVQELMFKILNEQPGRLEQCRPGVPKGLADAIERALAKSPTERFADAREFATAIAPYMRLAGAEQWDSRAATVDLERDGETPSSAKRGHAALALSSIIGLGVVAALPVVGFATTVTLLGGAVGVANAGAAASSGFVASADVDAPFIDHEGGQWVRNKDTANAHNALASLGSVGGPLRGTSIATVNVRATHENANTGPLACRILLNQRDTGAELPPVILVWNQNDTGTKAASFTLAARQSYFVTVFCNIPMKSSGGPGTRVFGAWTS